LSLQYGETIWEDTCIGQNAKLESRCQTTRHSCLCYWAVGVMILPDLFGISVADTSRGSLSGKTCLPADESSRLACFEWTEFPLWSGGKEPASA
jgi:hypothetical protein